VSVGRQALIEAALVEDALAAQIKVPQDRGDPEVEGPAGASAQLAVI
jgi:hypothetical protein